MEKKLKEYTYTLPRGYTIVSSLPVYTKKDDNWEALMGIYNSGDWASWETEIVKTKPKAVCECGQTKISGHEGDSWNLHSNYCPIYKEGKLNEGK